MKQIVITYFVHGTTIDNEKGVATGWRDGKLSPKGVKESLDLGAMFNETSFDGVYSSDSLRAFASARLAFGDRYDIVTDARLRECNFGTFTGGKWSIIEARMARHITEKFPEGESYRDVERRMWLFLTYVIEQGFSRIAMVSHQAPQLALEVITKGKTWQQAMQEDWRAKLPKEWRPGWEYVYEER